MSPHSTTNLPKVRLEPDQIEKILRTIVQLLREGERYPTFIDVVNRAEALGIIASAGQWL